MPTLNLGQVRFVPRGEYDNTASYTNLDVVFYEGNSYFCTVPIVSGVTPTDEGASQYWQLLIDRHPVTESEVQSKTGTQTVALALDSRGIVFDSVADMQAFAGLQVGAKVRTLGYYSPGDGGGNDYEIVAAGTGNNYGFLYEQLTGSGLEAKLLGGGIMEDKTAYIPTDYGTLQDAIDHVSSMIIKNQATVSLVIESGHSPESGWGIANVDVGFVTVRSLDSVVMLSPTFTGSNLGSGLPGISSNCAFYTENGTAPKLGCLFDATNVVASGSNALAGYVLYGNSTGSADAGCGVIGAHRNLDVRGSKFFGRGSVFKGSRGIITDSVYHNVRVTANSLAELADSDVSGSSFRGLDVSRGSLVYANGANANDCAGVGMEVRRSFLVAQDSSAENCDIGYYVNLGSTLIARGASAQNCQTAGARIEAGIADLGDGDFDNSDTGINVIAGSSCYCNGATARQCITRGFLATQGSTLSAKDSDASGSGIGIEAFGSNVYAENVNAIGCTRGVQAFDSYINLFGADIVNSIERGVSASRCTIDCNLAVITGSDYGIVCLDACDIRATDLDVSGNAIEGIQVSSSGNFVRVRNLTGSINMTPNSTTFLGIFFTNPS